ncbi:alpha/beta fold hydrolase [Mycobacterium sp. Z3061]|uniref:alpha/beta fold hydrolase n=1 Tax=Mycobacterium sp. Z3061 TaxID=3073562 RepID=UPI0037C6559F
MPFGPPLDCAAQIGRAEGDVISNLVLATRTGRVRCFAVDVAGCGTKRGRDTSSLDVDDIADELVREIVAAGMEHVVLVGHSHAGMLLPRIVEGPQ